MDRVLIGSAAIEERAGNLLGRLSKDRDYLTLNPVPGADNVDGSGILDKYSFVEEIATLDEVYTLKVSHSPWVIDSLSNWYKHLWDVQKLKEHGAHLIPELHDAAYREWEARRGAKNVNLDQDKEAFFNNSVKRYYEHDSVHAAVALGSEPAFNKILADGSEVKTSRRKFESLPDFQKRALVYEETFVLSLERDLIPYSIERAEPAGKGEMYDSYRKQLRLLITQYSKGWWTRWIIEHYQEVFTPPLDYWKMFADSEKPTLIV